MSNVTDIHTRFSRPGHGVEDGSEPPHDGDMEARVAKLEAIIPTLATKADVQELRLATKADVEKASHDVTKWVVGTMVGGVGLFIVIMTFVLNNAVPKAAPAPVQQPAPIVIQVPAPAPPAAPHPAKQP